MTIVSVAVKLALRVVFILWSLLWVPSSFGMNPCEGRGTFVFFVNGVFNEREDARKNMAALEMATRPEFPASRKLVYELAFVKGFARPLQFTQAVVQKGLDDFESYWLWLEGVEKSPDERWCVVPWLLGSVDLDPAGIDTVTKKGNE